MHRLASALASFVVAATLASPSEVDAKVHHASGVASKKGGPAAAPPPLLSTLVSTHTDARVPLDDASPSPERWSALLADHVTGDTIAVEPRLLDLLRALARKHPNARIEIVSGYRSPKRNEMMRKKGHHVASHSQHSLGHAVDFRVVVAEASGAKRRGGPGGVGGETPDVAPRGVDPRILEQEIRALGWEGGVGVYTLKDDWFVHADVGAKRRWNG